MKIEFRVEPNNDELMIFKFFGNDDWEYRAKEMGIDVSIANAVHSGKDKILKDAERKIEKLVENAYVEFKDELETAKNKYQKSWDQIIEEFSNAVSQTTYPWFFDKYIVDITHFTSGFSNSDGNTVGIWWKDGVKKQRRITAHEILLAHFSSIHINLYKGSGLSDNQIWALSEIFAFAMTGLEPKLTKFWPLDKSGHYTDHNYPEIVPLQEALKEPFLKRSSFDYYIKKGIKLVRKLYL